MNRSKKSSEEAPEGSQPSPRKHVLKGCGGRRFLGCVGRKGMPGESESSTDWSKTDEVPSKGTDDGKKVFKPKDLEICGKEESQFRSIPEGKEKPGEPQSSKVNENPEGPKKDEVSSEGTGGKKVFKPKELKICWQEDNQFWSIPNEDGLPAELLKVCWLDVSGEMNVTKGKTYEVSFMLSMNTENSFGWDVPVTVMARIGKEGEYQSKEIYLSDLGKYQVERPQDKCRIEFKSDEKANNNEGKLYFGLYETWTNKWKGGLRIHEAIVQEITAGNNASTSNTESRGKGIAAHDD